MSSLFNTFQSVLARFRPNHPNAPATTYIFGFVTPDEQPVSVMVNREQAQISGGVEHAEYLIFGALEDIQALLNPEMPERARVINRLELRPNYPFKNFLFAVFLNAFDLEIAGLDTTPARFDGPFPFPPRYPVGENVFRQRVYQPQALPAFAPEQIPQLVADDHPTWARMYDKAWQIAFKNLRQPEANSVFVANFIDTAFNANSFMWDSCFMMMFGRFARRNFNFMGTLENFYAKQHDDGFICREINTYSGTDLFQSLDPRSTGPNILAWTEWQDYLQTGDDRRLREVFPVLVGYHRWWKEWRTHPDGGYWTSGWGSGMDNQTRVPNSEYHHRYYTWTDAMMQQALNCRILLNMAGEIGRDEFDAELLTEFEHIKAYLNGQMWDEASGFYYDRAPDGSLSVTKHVGVFWGLLSDVIPPERLTRVIAHLEDEHSFARPHPVPSQAYDSADYNPYGGYWLGGVWSPTNYMVLRGLTQRGYDDLAYRIAGKHVDFVAQVFEETGTLWENYAPEHAQPGIPAKPNFVGWTGISAITIPLEYLIGVRPMERNAGLMWDIRLTEKHGVLRYPFGQSNHVDLICDAREDENQPPQLTINTQDTLTLDLRWGTIRHRVTLDAGKHHISFED